MVHMAPVMCRGWVPAQTALEGSLISTEASWDYIYPLVMTNIAMENGPFIDGLPIKNGDFPWLC